MPMKRDFDEDEWHGLFGMDIETLRLFYDHICYSIEVWPGAPRRPVVEQEFLIDLKMQVFSMIMEYNLNSDS